MMAHPCKPAPKPVFDENVGWVGRIRKEHKAGAEVGHLAVLENSSDAMREGQLGDRCAAVQKQCRPPACVTHEATHDAESGKLVVKEVEET